MGAGLVGGWWGGGSGGEMSTRGTCCCVCSRVEVGDVNSDCVAGVCLIAPHDTKRKKEHNRNEQLVHDTPLHTRMGGQVGALADDVVAIERGEEGLVRVDFDFFFMSAIGGQHNSDSVCGGA